eukprot:scaffold1912_cov167-Amphora_coffeaeformis.AAC.23
MRFRTLYHIFNRIFREAAGTFEFWFLVFLRVIVIVDDNTFVLFCAAGWGGFFLIEFWNLIKLFQKSYIRDLSFLHLLPFVSDCNFGDMPETRVLLADEHKSSVYKE